MYLNKDKFFHLGNHKPELTGVNGGNAVDLGVELEDLGVDFLHILGKFVENFLKLWGNSDFVSAHAADVDGFGAKHVRLSLDVVDARPGILRQNDMQGG